MDLETGSWTKGGVVLRAFTYGVCDGRRVPIASLTLVVVTDALEEMIPAVPRIEESIVVVLFALVPDYKRFAVLIDDISLVNDWSILGTTPLTPS